jgi:hypothetical protein
VAAKFTIVKAIKNTSPAAICRGPIVDTVDLGLVEEFKTVSSFARRPVRTQTPTRRSSVN